MSAEGSTEVEVWSQFLKEQGPVTCFAAALLWWCHRHAWPFIKNRIEKADEQRDQMMAAVKDNSTAVRQLSTRMEQVVAAVNELRNDVSRQQEPAPKQRHQSKSLDRRI
jgi:hypothetical protein